MDDNTASVLLVALIFFAVGVGAGAAFVLWQWQKSLARMLHHLNAFTDEDVHDELSRVDR